MRIKARGLRFGDKRGHQGVTMTQVELSITVLVLLLTPGPTNSLMMLAGAERGHGPALWLIPAELAGYLVTVGPLMLMGQSLLAAHPGLTLAVGLMAAVWVALLALRLWRLPGTGGAVAAVGARSVFVTTALNPKALIFGVVLLPSPDHGLANLVLFAGLVAVVAVLWAGLGAMLRGDGKGQPRALFLLRRLASMLLMAMSLMLVFRGVSA